MNQLDGSVKLFIITFIGTIFSNITKSDVAFSVTVLVGLSSLVYNIIKIQKALKQKTK